MRSLTRYALLVPIVAALVAAGCGGDTPKPADPAQPGAEGAEKPGAEGEPAKGAAVAAQEPNAGPLPEVPAASAPVAMRLAGSEAAYGYLVFPSLHGAIDRVKEIAKLVDENVPADDFEADMLRGLDLNPAALAAVKADLPAVMIMLEPDMEEGEPKMVAVLPVTSAADFRKALVTPPPPPPGLPPGADPADFVGKPLAEKEAEAGIFTYSKMVKEFDWDAYEKAQQKAMDEGGKMPDMDAFQKEREAVKFAVAEMDGHVLVSNAVEPIKALRDAKQPETVPAVPAGDLAVFVSAERLRGTFKDQLEEFITEMHKGIEEAANEASPMPTSAAALKGVGDAMEAVVRESQGVHLNIALGKPALRYAIGATFSNDGKVADMLRTQIHDGPDYVKLLPADSLLVSSSRIRYTPSLREWVNGSNAEMFKMLRDESGMPEDDAELQKIVDSVEELFPRLYSVFTGEAAAAVTLSATKGLDIIEVVRVEKPGEATKLAVETVDIVKSIIAKAHAELKKQEEEMPFSIEVEHVTGAIEHKGTKINTMQLKIGLPDDMPGIAAAELELVRSVLIKLLGSADTFTVYYAEHGESLVFALGASAQARVLRVLDHLIDGTTEGPGGEFSKIAEGMGNQPTMFVYFAPLAIANETIEIVADTQHVGCMAHQGAVAQAVEKFKTLNGAYPDNLFPLKEQDLIPYGRTVPCEDRFQIDPNSGAVRCSQHGTPAAPIAAKSAGEALGIEWSKPTGSAGFAYYANVFDRPEGVGAEFGMVSTLDTFGEIAKAVQPLMGAFGGGGGGNRLSMNESAAIGSLRSLATAQEMFKQQSVVDQDEDGMGEYAFLGELAGVDAVRGSGLKMNTSPFIAAILGVKDQNGFSQKGGYYFRVFLPGKNGVLAEGSGAGTADGENADGQEMRWCAYAWPAAQGISGNRAFFVNQNGDVFATQAQRNSYSGPGQAPEANAAFDTEAADAANLDGKVGSVMDGLEANDGNHWMPARR